MTPPFPTRRSSDLGSALTAAPPTTGAHSSTTSRTPASSRASVSGSRETTTMAFVKRRTLLIMVGLSFIAVLAVAGFIWSGLYSIGADDQRMGPVYSVLDTLRARTIEFRANEREVPAHAATEIGSERGLGRWWQ